MAGPSMRPLLVLAALAAATELDFGRGTLGTLKDRLRSGLAKDPMGATVGTVLLAAALFYRAERGHNPKVKSYYDALVYVSTNLSVGYSDIFAKTATGKAIGTALMTFGPAMAANILDADEMRFRGLALFAAIIGVLGLTLIFAGQRAENPGVLGTGSLLLVAAIATVAKAAKYLRAFGGPAEKEAPPSDDPRWSAPSTRQLVGASCAMCEQKIAIAFGAVTCRRCDAALHGDCEAEHRKTAHGMKSRRPYR